MAKMTIIPGPCNLVTHIEATQTQPFVAQLNIESKCEAVQKLAAELDTLTMQDVADQGFRQRPGLRKSGHHPGAQLLSGGLGHIENRRGGHEAGPAQPGQDVLRGIAGPVGLCPQDLAAAKSRVRRGVPGL